MVRTRASTGPDLRRRKLRRPGARVAQIPRCGAGSYAAGVVRKEEADWKSAAGWKPAVHRTASGGNVWSKAGRTSAGVPTLHAWGRTPRAAVHWLDSCDWRVYRGAG